MAKSSFLGRWTGKLFAKQNVADGKTYGLKDGDLVSLPFSKEYPADGNLVWVNGPAAAGQISIAHGLGVIPKLYMLYGKCTTAIGEYAIGDIIVIAIGQGDYTGAAPGYGVCIVNPDATNVFIGVGSSGTWNGLTKNTKVHISLPSANFQFGLRAWA